MNSSRQTGTARPRGRRLLRKGLILVSSLFLVLSLACAGTLISGSEVLAAEPPPEAADAPRKPPTTFYSTAYVRGDMGIRVIDYWSRGSSMRARTLIGGHPILTLVEGDRYVVVDLLTAKGVDIRRPAAAVAQDAERSRPFAFELEEIIRDGGEKIEDVAFGPLAAEIWQVRDGRGRRKVWVSAKEPRVPLRVETFSRAASNTTELDYSNWIFDMELPAEFFRPPQGIQLEVLEYEAYEVKSAAGTVTNVPILYPDLLHGLVTY